MLQKLSLSSPCFGKPRHSTTEIGSKIDNAIRSSRFEDALSLIERHPELPQTIELKNVKAISLLRLGRLGEAEAAAQQVLKENHDDPEAQETLRSVRCARALAQVDKAEHLTMQGQYREAQAIYTGIGLASDLTVELQVHILTSCANCLNKHNEHTQALEKLEAALALRPAEQNQIVDILVLKAAAQRGLGKEAAAIRSYNDVLDFFPDLTEVPVAALIGQCTTMQIFKSAGVECYYQLGQYEEGCSAARNAIPVLSETPQSHTCYLLAFGLIKLRRYDEAIKLLSGAGEEGLLNENSEPLLGLSYALKGQSLLEAGNAEQAAEAFRQSIDISAETSPEVFFNLAFAYIKCHKEGEARKILLRLLQKTPQHLQAQATLGLLLIRQKDYKQAIKYLELAAQNPQFTHDAARAEVLQNLSVTLIQLGRSEQARGTLQELLVLNPDHIAARHALKALEDELAQARAPVANSTATPLDRSQRLTDSAEGLTLASPAANKVNDTNALTINSLTIGSADVSIRNRTSTETIEAVMPTNSIDKTSATDIIGLEELPGPCSVSTLRQEASGDKHFASDANSGPADVYIPDAPAISYLVVPIIPPNSSPSTPSSSSKLPVSISLLTHTSETGRPSAAGDPLEAVDSDPFNAGPDSYASKAAFEFQERQVIHPVYPNRPSEVEDNLLHASHPVADATSSLEQMGEPLEEPASRPCETAVATSQRLLPATIPPAFDINIPSESPAKETQTDSEDDEQSATTDSASDNSPASASPNRILRSKPTRASLAALAAAAQPIEGPTYDVGPFSGSLPTPRIVPIGSSGNSGFDHDPIDPDGEYPVFDYEELKHPGPYPEQMWTQFRERYLADSVFAELFEMDKEAFAELPPWKQAHLKKELALF